METKVRFTKIKNNHNDLRDNVVEGTCNELPTVGKPFVMFAEARDIPNAFRRVSTSDITRTNYDAEANSYLVYTASGSTYKIDVL